MSLSFRAGTERDVEAVSLLAQHSFPGLGFSLERWSEYLIDSSLGGIETLWVATDDDRVVSACRCYPFEQWIGGELLPLMGLGLVTNSVLDRRRGIAAQLVASALEKARSEGQVASALYPFKAQFYQKLGYGMAGRALQYRLPPRSLPDHPARERIRLVQSDADRGAVRQIYESWAPSQTGQLARGTGQWQRIWEGQRYGVLSTDQSGTPNGYATFQYNTAAERGKRSIDIDECVWLDREARLGLHGWMASLSDQWDWITYRAHPDDGFENFISPLPYPSGDVDRWLNWFPAAVQMAGPMFRLLDVGAAWTQRNVNAGDPLSIHLVVDDAQLVANVGSWGLHFDDGKARVSRDPARSEGTVKTGIETLSRLFIGALSASEAEQVGLLEVDEPKVLDRLDSLLALPYPWTFDRF